MIILKIGGSLLDSANSLLQEIPRSKDILIVPGGGIFANFVREKNYDDDTAHFDAILSMNRYGRFLSTFGFPVVTEPVTGGKTSILLPFDYLKKTDPLPHSWDVTSDSIAAWIAAENHVSLILVKSVTAEFSPALKATDIVDPYVFKIVEEHPDLQIKIVNGRQTGALRVALESV